MMKKQIIPFLCFVFLICSCAIKNDIPYPIIEAEILSMEVEGQCASPSGGSTQAAINKKERTVTLYVDDTVDLANLKINRLISSAFSVIHSLYCLKYYICVRHIVIYNIYIIALHQSSHIVNIKLKVISLLQLFTI